MDDTGKEPKIGVFICHCGSNIAGVVDVESVVEFTAKLPHVVYADHNMYSCSEDGLQFIKKAIKERDINRVVVASCTPRTHAPLFQSACEEVGVNKYLFDLVNIRDQCSWVHMKEKEKATEKAKRLVRMGVARVSLLESQDEVELEVLPVVLVIGGGIAGMKAAQSLANQGYEVHLVEKEGELGGMLKNLYTLFPFGIEAKEILDPLISAVKEHNRIEIHLNTEIKDIKGYIGNFTVIANKIEIRTGTIIIATGAEVLKPEGMYGYGSYKNVVTQLEFEEMLKKGDKIPKKVVMIQCVGARIPERTYCARICCMTAIKNGLAIKRKHPESEIYILYRDIITPGKEKEMLYQEAMDLGVKFIQYTEKHMPEVSSKDEKIKIKLKEPSLDEKLELEPDLLILSVPLVPREENPTLSKMLKVPLDKNGFFLEAHVKLRPLDFATDGIFLCGTARFPSDVNETMAQAYGAAGKAVIPIRKGKIKGEAIYAEVDPSKCVGCGVCEEVCEFGAPSLDLGETGLFVSSINKILCKGCGVCAVSCPSRAISMHHFRDDHISEQIETALEEVL
ncbi:MAG: CoB--CoM heterodisulfide reductase iron-sulfur subunit A family protein [Thermoplasmata archaeon]|nr:MAG: CoB--CoM heterodisulfide reductase iron-sulfur subunit A family protein [Thermoplasmata archaeon]